MTKETKDLVKEMNIVVVDIFDKYDKGVYSKEEMLEIDKWINETYELNDSLKKYDVVKPKSKNKFLDAIARFFVIKTK